MTDHSDLIACLNECAQHHVPSTRNEEHQREMWNDWIIRSRAAMANAATALAQQAAELAAMKAGLRKHAIKRRISLPNKLVWNECAECSGSWEDSAAERHTANCIVALPPPPKDAT